MATFLSHVILLICFQQLVQSRILRNPSKQERKAVANAESWRYDDQSRWSGTCTAGRSQSPVDLVLDVFVRVRTNEQKIDGPYLGQAEVVNYDSMKFNNYHLTGPVVVDNSGHSVTVKGFFDWEQPPSITGANLKTMYILRQLHFHWDSEHTFNGLHYSAELHLVHISDKYDPSLNMSLSGNVAVVAVPLNVGEPEAALDGIEILFMDGNLTESSGTISFSPSVLLPTDTKTFYRYSGSLTTPPCTEGITWTIFAEPVLLSAEQEIVMLYIDFFTCLARKLVLDIFDTLASLKGAQSHDDAAEGRISRWIQSMNGRKLYLNKAGRTFLEEDTLSRVVIIFGLLIMLMIAPPLLILWVIYKRTTLPNSNITTSSASTMHTEAPRAEHGFTRAELEVPREEPGASGGARERFRPAEERAQSTRHGRIYECLCVSPEEDVLPYHGE